MIDIPDGKLRKRTVGGRSRSVEPRHRVETDSWEEFKEKVTTLVPNLVFPDEYMDDGIMSASVSGLSVSGFNTLLEMEKAGIIKLQDEDDRIILEYDTKRVVKAEKPTTTIDRRIWLCLIWLVFFALTVRFVISNYEMYRKLWWT